MCVTSLCTRGALDGWSRGRSTAAFGNTDDVSAVETTASFLGDQRAAADRQRYATEEVSWHV
jgi:hypothetical protein